jgi:hypothetical protein
MLSRMTQPGAGPPQVTLRSIQMIVGALALGLAAFTAVAAAVVASRGPLSPDPHLANMLLIVLFPLWFASVIGGVVLGRATSSRLARGPAEGRTPESLLAQFSSITIIRSALAEGPGLFGAIVLLLSGWYAAALAPFLSLVVMALSFPTRERLDAFERAAAVSPIR